MDTVRQITNELAIAGQPTLDEFQQLAEAGYRSVVNLRFPSEIGFLDDEQQKVESLELCYINVSISKDLNLDDMLSAIQQLNQLPNPMLVHCDNGIRSSMLVLMRLSMDQGIRAEDAFQKVMKTSSFSYRS
jgi:uncharacterized protein (TIGR01244 family)